MQLTCCSWFVIIVWLLTLMLMTSNLWLVHTIRASFLTRCMTAILDDVQSPSAQPVKNRGSGTFVQISTQVRWDTFRPYVLVSVYCTCSLSSWLPLGLSSQHGGLTTIPLWCTSYTGCKCQNEFNANCTFLYIDACMVQHQPLTRLAETLQTWTHSAVFVLSAHLRRSFYLTSFRRSLQHGDFPSVPKNPFVLHQLWRTVNSVTH